MVRVNKAAACTVALVVTAFALMVAPAFASVPHDDRYTMAIIGDTPYGQPQIDNFPADIAEINADPHVRFVVHVGDIKNGSSLCTDSYFSLIRSDFNQFVDPLVYTPGDNEWTDCHRANNGAYTPTERLAKLRSVFFDNPGHSLGQRSALLRTQTPNYPENVRFKRANVEWGVINLPGSNDDLVPWFGAPVTPAQQAEHDNRLAANLKWLDSIFLRAKRAHVKAIAIGLQADMFDPAAVAAGQVSAYAPIIHKLATKAAEFGKPVLLINGDSHIFGSDHPFASGQQAGTIYGESTLAPNIERVTVEGSTSVPHEWLRLHISQTDPNVFSFENVPFAAH
jgi:hypothetical protein